MNARQSNACLLSALLHGTVVALLLLLGYVFSQSAPDTVKVFELVAGAGDNYAATEAPALGVPGGIKVKVTMPAPPAPVPAPAQREAAPPVPAPAPVPVAPPKVPPPAATTPAKSDEVPNFKKIEQRAASRKAAHLEWVYKRQLAAQNAAVKKQESYAKFLEEQKSKASANHNSTSAKAPKVDAEGIAAGVVGGSTANKTGGAGGKALSREQQDLLDSYFAMLKSRLKENHVPPPGVSDKLEAYLEFVVAADGSISHLRFLRSSGNSEFDDSVREAFAHTHMPARPDGRTDTRTLTFRLHDDDAE